MSFHRAAAAAALWAAGLSPAFAQAVFSEVPAGQETESASPEAQALARIRADKTTRSVSVVRIDGALLRNKRDGNLELNVRPGVTLDATPESIEEGEEGRFVWTGEIPASAGDRESAAALPAGSATIVVNGDSATGTIQTPGGKLFKIRPLGGGQNALIEVDQAKRPPEHPPGGPKVQPKSEGDLLPPGNESETESAARPRPVIDLVVAYTKNAKEAAGDIPSLIALAISETNKSFTNSGVKAAMRLVHTAEYAYPDTDKNMEEILNDFAGSGDGQMDTIHGLRNQYGGDVAVLIVDNSEYCGIARDIGATAATAYVIVYRDCATGYYSFGHEIGHLAGARHDPGNDPTATPFAHGHGFQKSKPENGWRTVMGYACGDDSCPTRIQYWSNPAKMYQGVAMGVAGKQDNARVWNQRARVMAAFKTKGRTDEPAVVDRPAPTDSKAADAPPTK